jgi:hypothetical protein
VLLHDATLERETDAKKGTWAETQRLRMHLLFDPAYGLSRRERRLRAERHHQPSL